MTTNERLLQFFYWGHNSQVLGHTIEEALRYLEMFGFNENTMTGEEMDNYQQGLRQKVLLWDRDHLVPIDVWPR
jgi:hypothetical protein